MGTVGDESWFRLAGQSAELGVLRAVVEDAAEGRVRVALVDGEAGIGKSRLLRETVMLAERLGFRGGFSGSLQRSWSSWVYLADQNRCLSPNRRGPLSPHMGCSGTASLAGMDRAAAPDIGRYAGIELASDDA
jgi:hypothetical protein